MEDLESRVEKSHPWRDRIAVALISGALLLGLSGCYHHRTTVVRPSHTYYKQHNAVPRYEHMKPSHRHRIPQHRYYHPPRQYVPRHYR